MSQNQGNAAAMLNSSRVLNLHELTARRERTPALVMDDGNDEPPPDDEKLEGSGDFFLNKTLNSAVIIKHRPDETDRRRMEDPDKLVGTKVFVRYGADDGFDDSGKYMFLGQKQSNDIFREHFGLDPVHDPKAQRDLNLLRVLDRLPSLDPFLLRDRLMRDGYDIDEMYFRLSETEAKRYRSQVIREFYPLAETAFKDAPDVDRLSNLIVERMWEATDLQVLKPMMGAMEIDFNEAPDIFFAWKGFVYYKLMMQRLAEGFAGFIMALQAAKPINMPTNIVRDEIEALRPRLVKALRHEYDLASAQIEEYDHAYRHQMIRLSKPVEFTRFLRRAPYRFEKLGASVAGVEHAQSDWRRRFGSQKEPMIPAQDMLDLLSDFADGVSLEIND
ncbi:MAG: hypothetical protein KI792_11575 [Alphaproteobacteria bacterium]|nr:hypothetical protein [Alphaproteobacteria bacterium SS10]